MLPGPPPARCPLRRKPPRRRCAPRPRWRARRSSSSALSFKKGRRTPAAFFICCGDSIPIELVDLLHVVVHRVVLGSPLQLGPRVIFGPADEIEAARTVTL